MAWTGFALLLLVGCGILFTGLPAFVVLITAAALGACIGLATDTFPLALLGALPGRLINLFESDLLQALPLYVTMGLLLDRLPVADALYRASIAVLPRKPSAPMVSGMLLGALLGPMNGSVGASVLGLSRVVAPKLAAEGVPPAKREALIAVASTLGVLVPPSLVLILLSDAMLQCAHLRGDADRTRRPRHQYAGCVSRRPGAGRNFSRSMSGARLVQRARRYRSAETREVDARTRPARRICARRTPPAARRRRHRLFLRGRSRRHGRFRFALCRYRDRAAARRGHARAVARRHGDHRRAVLAAAGGDDLHAGAAAFGH